MAKYKDGDINTGIFTPVYLERQIMRGTFEWTLCKLIDKMDLSAFDKKYKNDKAGAAAYPPGIMLKAILFCYSSGTGTDRRRPVCHRRSKTTVQRRP
jgi:hypothetical protein